MKRKDYTRAAILDSLLALLKKNPDEKITVTKLCAMADINRATFYQHYSSIDDLYEKVLTDVYSDIILDSNAILESSGSTADAIRRIVTVSLQRYADDPAFYPLLTHLNRDKLHRFIYSRYVPKELDTPYLRIQMDFIMSGGEGVFSQWLAKGCVTPVEEIADAISSMIFKCFN